MLSLPNQARVFLCAAPIDLRKSFDGLSGLVESVFGSNVLDGQGLIIA
jgi:transposase